MQMHVMSTETLYMSTFLMGLFGGTHCAGMCGGIVSALTLGIPSDKRKNKLTFSLFLLSYNTGRILSYIIAGIVISTIGVAIGNIGDGLIVRKVFTVITATMIILLGLYLTGWWTGFIIKLELVGSILWRRVEPIANKFVPVSSNKTALIAGMLWGWIPCGLVYTILLLAMTAESIYQGAMIMAIFGAGTLPTLLGVGYLSGSLATKLQKKWVRTSAGIMVSSFGIYQLQIIFFS
jgi:sulfite exporter TauE/SafE